MVAATVAVGKTPHWVAASADSQTAYVTNEGSNDVSVVDLGRRTVVATIPVGNAPRKVAVQPGAIRRAAAEPMLRADDYYFAPASLRGHAGERLRLRVENTSGTLHNLTVPALGLDRDLPPGGRVEIDLQLPGLRRPHLPLQVPRPPARTGSRRRAQLSGNPALDAGSVAAAILSRKRNVLRG